MRGLTPRYCCHPPAGKPVQQQATSSTLRTRPSPTQASSELSSQTPPPHPQGVLATCAHCWPACMILGFEMQAYVMHATVCGNTAAMDHARLPPLFGGSHKKSPEGGPGLAQHDMDGDRLADHHVCCLCRDCCGCLALPQVQTAGGAPRPVPAQLPAAPQPGRLPELHLQHSRACSRHRVPRQRGCASSGRGRGAPGRACVCVGVA